MDLKDVKNSTNQKLLKKTILAVVFIDLTAAYFWLALGLAGKVHQFFYMSLLIAMLAGSIPVAIGIIRKSNVTLAFGLVVSVGSALMILGRNSIDTTVQNNKSYLSAKNERAEILSKALVVLTCENGYFVYYQTTQMKDKTPVKSLELLDPEMKWPAEILCVQRGDSAALCRGLERRRDLRCKNEKFNSVEELKKFYF